MNERRSIAEIRAGLIRDDVIEVTHAPDPALEPVHEDWMDREIRRNEEIGGAILMIMAIGWGMGFIGAIAVIAAR